MATVKMTADEWLGVYEGRFKTMKQIIDGFCDDLFWIDDELYYNQQRLDVIKHMRFYLSSLEQKTELMLQYIRDIYKTCDNAMQTHEELTTMEG